MNSGIISIRYAKALLAYGNESGSAETLYRETGRLADSFAVRPELSDALANPVLSEAKKIGLIHVAAGGAVSQAFERFIRLLTRNRRLPLLRWISLMYGDLYRREKHVVQARLVTAADLPAGTEAALEERLAALTADTLEIRTEVKPALIGGYRFYYDTYRLDASVASRLRTIREKLKN